MTDDQTNLPRQPSTELDSQQQRVVKLLGVIESSEYPFSDWYRGAVYTLKNMENPDRYSQAAHSMRELLEKLLRTFSKDESELENNISEIKKDLLEQLCSNKKSSSQGLRDVITNDKLDKAIKKYRNSRDEARRERQMDLLMGASDPMYGTLDKGAKSKKINLYSDLQRECIGISHHRSRVNDDDSFRKIFYKLNSLIITLLGPSIEDDHAAIQAIIAKPNPDQNDFEELFELIRYGANYIFFFNSVDNPAWITPLHKKGLFENSKDTVNKPWAPITFLRKISSQEPEKVVEIILELEDTDNPYISYAIFEIACDLSDVDCSLRLEPIIRKLLKSPYREHKSKFIISILEKWGNGSEESLDAALKIARYLTAFEQADLQEEKYQENIEEHGILPDPAPRFSQWEYQEILEKGIRPLSEKEPFRVALILLNATREMIKMTTRSDTSNEDHSEFWCRRLDKSDSGHQDVKAILAHTLAYACEQVKTPECIEKLNQALRKQDWKIFKRLRRQIYASHLSKQTLPWIRELILKHESYSESEYDYELQLMIRKSSEYFGHKLLNKEKQIAIFEIILKGPSKEDFRKQMGERYSEEDFQKRQYRFHHMQLRPFEALLTGKYRDYFDKLMNEDQEEAITDDSYCPTSEVKVGYSIRQSPKSLEALGAFTDNQLLSYINEWDEEGFDKDNWLVKITISSLADVFQSLFKEKIIPDKERLAFWMDNHDKIERPIYVAAMVKAMQEIVNSKDFTNLEHWIKFCAWVVPNHDSEELEDQPRPLDQSRNYPDWSSSREAVVSFIDTCVDKDINVPISAREGLVDLLRHLCTQFDRHLDQDMRILLNRDDKITEAINNARSQALRSLILFGFWIRRHLPEDPVLEISDILSERMSKDSKYPLTRPENALLGMYFGSLCALDQDWATKQKEFLFPQDNMPVWCDAFSSYIDFNQPTKIVFEILKKDFDYALEHLDDLKTANHVGKSLVGKLGEYLFFYYLWKIYPLTGDESLLARFYEKTNEDKKHWAQLFRYVGWLLRNSDENAIKEITSRITDYFDWRLGVGEPLELQEFSFWLEAECLDAEWRLRSYLKILNLGDWEDSRDLYMEMKTLTELLPKHLPLVIECFAKIASSAGRSAYQYISTEDAKLILDAGLKAEDEQVRKNAKNAKEYLLRAGRSDIL